MSKRMEEGSSSYQGRSYRPRVGHSEKSAEAVVVTRYEPVQITGSLTEVIKGRTLSCLKFDKEVQISNLPALS